MFVCGNERRRESKDIHKKEKGREVRMRQEGIVEGEREKDWGGRSG